MTIGTSMSGCGCNKESSCDDTKQKQNESETDSCKGKDSATEVSKSSCCGNELQQGANSDEILLPYFVHQSVSLT